MRPKFSLLERRILLRALDMLHTVEPPAPGMEADICGGIYHKLKVASSIDRPVLFKRKIAIGSYFVEFFFAWFDFWVGVYVDDRRGITYINPLPGFVFSFYRRV